MAAAAPGRRRGSADGEEAGGRRAAVRESGGPAGGGSLAVAPLRHVVDWGAVQAELARLAPEFQNARFESLPHVVEVLSSVDPEQTLREVRRPGPPPPPGS